MKYLIRFIVYLALAACSFSVFAVAVLRVVPVTVTPLKVVRLFENAKAGVSSKWVPLDRIGEPMVRAVVATEDNNFLKHHGFDFEAIEQAVRENREGRRLRGASTISQQTAKNVFCPPSRTWIRKGVESWFTVLVEVLWGKRRIMEVYLNVIETGRGVYGVEAAAEKFYKKKAAELNVYEAAMIATVLPNPLLMNVAAPSPYMTRRAAQVRRNMKSITNYKL